MLCLHHNDPDGRASAFCVHAWAKVDADQSGELRKCEFEEIDYSRPIPFEKIEPNEAVWIVDFSLQNPGDWERLLSITKNVTWIDHHISAIKKSENGPAKDLPGIREEGKDAACVLTYQYTKWLNDKERPKDISLKELKHKYVPPLALQLISDHDAWVFDYGEKTAYFHSGISLHDISPLSGFWWKACIMTESARFVDDVCAHGEIICSFKEKFYAGLRKRIGFETSIDGHSAFAMNTFGGSEGFGFPNGWRGELPDEYDVLISFSWDGKKYTVGLYSKRVDVSKLADARGGGGHPGAAGFICNELPKELRKA